MEKLNRTYITKELEIAGRCDLCRRWFKGKNLGAENVPLVLEPEFGKLNIEDSIILCKSCFEKKHLGGFKNE